MATCQCHTLSSRLRSVSLNQSVITWTWILQTVIKALKWFCFFFKGDFEKRPGDALMWLRLLSELLLCITVGKTWVEICSYSLFNSRWGLILSPRLHLHVTMPPLTSSSYRPLPPSLTSLPQHSCPMSFLVQPWLQHIPATPMEKFLFFLLGLGQ